MNESQQVLEDSAKETILMPQVPAMHLPRPGGKSKQTVVQPLSCDLTGKVFGELMVLKQQASKRSGSVCWQCRCSCGELLDVPATLLVTGKRTHCGGPAHEKHYAYVDITGKKINSLTALYPLKERDPQGYVIWHCRCDCGREVDLSYNTLVYTNQRSCGCQKKEHDQKLRTFLTHVAGTSVDMLKSKKIPKDNTTGYKGVYLVRGKYIAKIVFQKKQYLLGTYENIEDAANARREAEEVLFDGVAEPYRKWKERADTDSEWARENPVEVIVDQNCDKRLSVTLLPVL